MPLFRLGSDTLYVASTPMRLKVGFKSSHTHTPAWTTAAQVLCAVFCNLRSTVTYYCNRRGLETYHTLKWQKRLKAEMQFPPRKLAACLFWPWRLRPHGRIPSGSLRNRLSERTTEYYDSNCCTTSSPCADACMHLLIVTLPVYVWGADILLYSCVPV